ncbi:CBS domain-containing protein [Vibrio kanaloae]|uniref:DUF294 nucleotidyltransferase-like domain-containing protein n=1 Tax=Vibrio kanaloae TaxID=170673 RepID=UPI0010BE5FFE|nr:DUF294 nucleotidyltransferase-like domain-containing protein [Vibrio kanaloae]TKE90549.1 CBS domain-containing protein [Vibrio kanaloae]TKF18287.1 CBS domain-containing protein [Vibrio kanaloae]
MEESLLPNIVAFISNIDPFDQLSFESKNALASSVDIIYLIKGEILPSEKIVGQGLYLVRMGAVDQINHDGSLRSRVGEGDIFGFTQLHRNDECEYTVKAIESTLLYRIPKNTLQSLMNENPKIRDHFSDHDFIRLAHSAKKLPYDESIYLKTVEHVMNRRIAQVESSMSIQHVANVMIEKHRSNALVVEDGKLVGIVTDRDLTKRVIAKASSVLEPIKTVMTESPQVLEKDTLLLEAIEYMMQYNIRSVPIIDSNNVIGVLTATSLVEKNNAQAIFLISRIYRQESIEELVSLISQRYEVFHSLFETGVKSKSIQQIMTLIADAFNKRLLQLAESIFGPPPMYYSWFVAGSQARHEIHLNSDQDNGMILEREPTSNEMIYFSKLANFVCSGLDACGYALCPANKMASNDEWRVPVTVWENYYKDWIVNPDPQSILDISVFLDTRHLFGESYLHDQMLGVIKNHLRGNNRLLSILVANSTRVSPPLGLFRQFVLTKYGENRDVLNIKKQAVSLIVDLSRIYAMNADCLLADTNTRLTVAAERGIISQASKQELQEALEFINKVRFRHQSTSILKEQEITNYISPANLTPFERNHLKDAFRIIARYQESAQQRYNSKGKLV